MEKLKLKRLKIEKFRNVKPGTELHFRDSLNVLLGRNGTGKTTLLNLIVQLLRWDFSQMLEEEFALEYELETPDGTMLLRVRNEVLERLGLDFLRMLGTESPVERAGSSGELRIMLPSQEQLSLSFKGSKLWMELPDEAPPIAIEYSSPLVGEAMLGNMFLAMDRLFDARREPEEGGRWGRVLISTFPLFRIRRFDESLAYLEHITKSPSLFKTIRQGEGSDYVTTSGEGEPGGFAGHVRRTIKSAPDIDEVRLNTADTSASFLKRVVELLGFQSAQMRLQRTARTPPPNEQLIFGNLQFDFTRQDGSIINHSVLSYGQKRLLAFYYYQACNPGCLVADELVNGMHHEWIDACLEDIGDRQAFLTSQNPLLLDYLSFESAEEVRSSFVLCRTELHEGREQMVWENMTAEDSEGFFKAYQVAIQHVSELLRTRGLW
ncbi:AAA family ATPase [Archangium lansingense]|uniref:AAA family ATPase n=1 Tax=Archangium lansingense TaxID=2995310 RepID=A0ABT3ZW66_9BACT|nr:AAA family ATPase [Archangium lansinium]MCY1073653.1 AAA family ATPase [Archangium lansinium]